MKMNKIFDVIKKWVKGNRKITYTFPLQEFPNIDIVRDCCNMGDYMKNILDNFKNLPVKDVSFGLEDYSITKEDNSLMYKYLSSNDESICYVKTSTTTMSDMDLKELRVLVTMFSLGIDDEVWRFEFKPFVFYSSPVNDFDDNMTNVCIDYTNGFIKSYMFDVMLKKNNLIVPKVEEYGYVNKKLFYGSVKLYGNELDYLMFDLDPSLTDTTNDATTYLTIFNGDNIEDKISEDSLVVNVVRRTTTISDDESPIVPINKNNSDNVIDFNKLRVGDV